MDTYERIGAELGRLTDAKSRSYGASFATSAEALKLLYQHGVKPEQYANMLATARIWDKLGRIATDENAFSEEPWADIAGYGLLMAKRSRDQNGTPFQQYGRQLQRELREQLKAAEKIRTKERVVE